MHRQGLECFYAPVMSFRDTAANRWTSVLVPPLEINEDRYDIKQLTCNPSAPASACAIPDGSSDSFVVAAPGVLANDIIRSGDSANPAEDDDANAEVTVELLSGVDISIPTEDCDFGGPCTIVDAPTLGNTVVLEGDGSFVYTPAPGFYGVDAFAYKVCAHHDGRLQCD